MAPLWVVVTQLGDVWFVLLLLSVLYLSGGWLPGIGRPIGRRPVAYVMALGVGALGLTFALKLLLEIPRPPGAAMPAHPDWLSGALLDLYRDATSEDGYDVPSGHAAGAVAVYGGLALAHRGSGRPLMMAAGLASMVGASRVAIGVHSVLAVVTGLLLGATYLWAVTLLTDGGRKVARAFVVAVAMALAALAVGGFGQDVAALLGLAGGGMFAWRLFGDRMPPGGEPAWHDVLQALAGVAMVGGTFAGMRALGSPIASLVLSALLVLFLLTLPLLWRSGIARPGSDT